MRSEVEVGATGKVGRLEEKLGRREERIADLEEEVDELRSAARQRKVEAFRVPYGGEKY